MERRLAAILAADIAGFSRHMEADEEAALATLEGHQATAHACVAAFEGRVFGSAGDSVIAEFPSAVQAVRCALRMQADIAARNAELAPERRMLFRVGVHVGDVMLSAENVFGHGVNVADRLQSLAPPEGVCVSESAFEQVHTVLHLGYEDLGRHTAKNISEPIHVYRVTEGAAPNRAERAWPRPRPARLAAVTGALAVVAAAAAGSWWWWCGNTEPAPVPSGEEMRAVARPDRHFAVDNPAEVDTGEALTIYQRIQDEMAAAYAGADVAAAQRYQDWQKYTDAPYLSEQHGRRYLAIYANPAAAAYGRFEDLDDMPAGAVIAKDSFEVTERGNVFTGPLFVMEKMPDGFDASTGDWRYTMIRANGEIFGRTGGPNGHRVEFCAACHNAVAERSDHLYFPPEDARRRPLSLDR